MNHLKLLTATALMLAALSPVTQAQQANPRYVIQGDQVYDKKTELTWARCSVGQRWKEGVGCVGVVKEFTWSQANNQGGGGWRLPTKDELMTLVDQTQIAARRRPTIDEVAFPDMDYNKLFCWSSTPAGTSLKTGASLAWLVDFNNGEVYSFRREDTLAVRLVRVGQ